MMVTGSECCRNTHLLHSVASNDAMWNLTRAAHVHVMTVVIVIPGKYVHFRSFVDPSLKGCHIGPDLSTESVCSVCTVH